MGYLTLDEATTKLGELGEGAGTDSARWLVLRLDEPAEATLATPGRRCGGKRCEVTPPRLRRDLGCVCEQTALALRLWDRAFPGVPPGAASDARKRRYQWKCPACRVPFTSATKDQQYCPDCLKRERAA